MRYLCLLVLLFIPENLEAGLFRKSCSSCQNGQCAIPAIATPTKSVVVCSKDCNCMVTGSCTCKAGNAPCSCQNCSCKAATHAGTISGCANGACNIRSRPRLFSRIFGCP